VVDADIAERATIAPALGGSQEYGWVNQPRRNIPARLTSSFRCGGRSLRTIH
jgi:hypothetical protein